MKRGVGDDYGFLYVCFVPCEGHVLAEVWEGGCAPHAAQLAVSIVAGDPVLARPLQVQRNQVHPVPVPVEQVVGDVLREPGVELLHPVPGQASPNSETVQSRDAMFLLLKNNPRWKSQRKKIHRLAYRFSIDFKIYRLAYGFLCVNHKGLAKVYRFLVRAFFSQDFKNP